jgi:hypothetical protein
MHKQIAKRVERAQRDLVEIGEQDSDGLLGPGEGDMKAADIAVQLIVDLQPLLVKVAEQITK